MKEINPGCSLEGLMLKLKLQYFGHLLQRVDSLEKTLMLEGLGAGGGGDDRGWDGCRSSPTFWTWVWVNPGSWWMDKEACVLWFMASPRVRHNWAPELNYYLVISTSCILAYLKLIMYFKPVNQWISTFCILSFIWLYVLSIWSHLLSFVL